MPTMSLTLDAAEAAFLEAVLTGIDESLESLARRLCAAYNSSAVALLEAGLGAEAREQLDKAELLAGPGGPLEGFPAAQRELQATVHNNWACYYRRLQQPETALYHLRRAEGLEMAAAAAAAREGRGTRGPGHDGRGPLPEAGTGGPEPVAPAQRDAGQRAGPSAATLLNLAACCGSLGRHGEALRYAEQAVPAAAVELQVTQPELEAALLEGLTQTQLGEALPQLRRAEPGACSQMAMAYYNRAVEQEHMQQWQQALHSYRLALAAATRLVGRGAELTLTMQQSAEAQAANAAAEAAAKAAQAIQEQQRPAVSPAEQPVASTSSTPAALEVRHLNFAYPGLDGRPIPGVPPLLRDLCFTLPAGSTCLLLGANGAGKTTFLKILGGKHMIAEDAVRVLGRPPFHDTGLTVSGDLSYIGGNWQRDIAFAGTSIPLTGDFPASRMIDAVPGVDPARKARLIKVLDIDPTWRMHTVSEGQRRRVQICVGLLKPFKVLLLDEITVDLDVLGRANLMRFLKEECATRGSSIIYATHIFDGLEFWPSHVAYLAQGQLQFFKQAHEIPELAQGRLLSLVFSLLNADREAQLKARGPRPVEWDPSREGAVSAGEFSYAFNNGWVPGTMNSSLSTNAVMRT
ncbi:hypothetical protein GPECTOR_15g281 [Gonium pectorale]|uniref:ABC transporter domain-containing protein n=1 Tax=Gonium pectorale TaxID=33097 RepID=A0A150GLE1_GONPE|nr:hypothetical protein GPECTOR_15g281 [Gonium pectorale]|eukprot:KXZ50598.1 hypothetical protein GPECTOR_15g281 [Gonium pectorale]